ncbi:MAG: hypothetical protein H6606_05940 [Flavobacteriales bacterium]|nr:hypothetical protein [Flavobacteriales bacterium]
MKNKIQDVRNILIEQMEKLNDPDTIVDMERVKQINEIGKTLVESAKAEASFLKAVRMGSAMSRGDHSGFVPTSKQIEE